MIVPASQRPLTARQAAILEFIKEHLRVHAYPPTLREIGARFGIRSTNGVNDHLRALERKGYISREDMKSRAIHVRPDGYAEQVAASARFVQTPYCPTCGRPS